jgi:hypothetical protein
MKNKPMQSRIEAARAAWAGVLAREEQVWSR